MWGRHPKMENDRTPAAFLMPPPHPLLGGMKISQHTIKTPAGDDRGGVESFVSSRARKCIITEEAVILALASLWLKGTGDA